MHGRAYTDRFWIEAWIVCRLHACALRDYIDVLSGRFDSAQRGQQRTKGSGAVVRLFSWSASGPEQRLQTQRGRYLGLPRLRTERLTSMLAETGALRP